MKIILTFLVLIISSVLIAQNKAATKQNTPSTNSVLVSSAEKNNDKKIHYVEKRTRPVQNYSKGNFNSQVNKKPVVRKSDNQNKKTMSK